MPPPWINRSNPPASDHELRQLQLRWYRDDLWMRRIAFVVLISASLYCIVLLTLQPVVDGKLIGGILATLGALIGVGASRKGK